MNGTINFTSPAHLQNRVAIGNGEPDSEKKNTNPDYHRVGDKQNFSPYDSYHVQPLSRRRVTESPLNNSANQAASDLVPAATTGQAPSRSSGWTLELFTEHLRFHRCPYEKDIFGDDFYWQVFYPYFEMTDVFFDWVATAYTKDKKYNGPARIYQYLIPDHLRSRETKKLIGDIHFHDDGIVGYLARVLEKHPIDSCHLRKLEEKFAGKELELDPAANYHMLSDERKEFFSFNTEKQQISFFENVYSYLKDNPYRLARSDALKELISDFDRNGNGQSFHEYVLEGIKETTLYRINMTSISHNSRYDCLYTLEQFFDRCGGAVKWVQIVNQFYVLSKQQEQERRDQPMMV